MKDVPAAIAMASIERRDRFAGIERADVGDAIDRAALVELLDDEAADVRAAAVAKLGRAEHVDAERALLRALRDAAPSVREAAFGALARQGTRGLIEPAQRALALEPVWWVRRSAAFALAAVAGPSASAPLLRALEDPVWRVRHAALRALVAIGEADAAARAALMQPLDAGGAARDAHAFLAWKLVGATADDGAERAHGGLHDPDPAVVAARLLELRAGDVDPRALVAGLGHPHAPLRAEVVRLLAEAEVDVLAEALDACDDPRVPYRAEAFADVLERAPRRRRELAARVISGWRTALPHALAWALAETGDEAVARASIDADDDLLRMTARAMLGRSDAAAAEVADAAEARPADLDEDAAVAALGRRALPSTHRGAVAVCAASGDAALREAAGKLAAKNLDPWVRARAAELAPDTDDGWRALLDLSRDADLGVRAAAASAIEARDTRDAVCERLLASGQLSAEQRAAAYAVLTRAFDDRAREIARRGLEANEPDVVRAELAAVASVWSETPSSVEIAAARPRTHAPAKVVARRALGRSGVTVAPLGVSGAHELDCAALEQARGAGVNLFFWEPRYVELGRFLRRRAARDETVVASGSYDADARSIEREVDRARRRLRIDRIGVFLLFWARSPARLTGAGVDALVKLKARGAIGAMGFSTHDRALACDALGGAVPWDVVMTRHSAAHPGAERRLFARAKDAGTSVLTFSNLCYGRLVRGGLRACDCYRYSLAQAGVTACISAPRRARELEENLAVLDAPPMTADELAAMRAHGARVHDEDARWDALVRRGGEGPRERALSLLDASFDEPRELQ